MTSVSYNEKDKIWSGAKHESIFNSNVSLGYLILNEFNKTPERITQVLADTGVEVTCYEMLQRSIKMAKHLQSLDLKQGDVVGFMASNNEYLGPIVFSCFTLGLPANLLGPDTPENEVIHMFSMTKPKIVFCDCNISRATGKYLNEIANIKPAIYTLVDKVEGYKFVEDVFSADDRNSEDFVFPDLDDIANSTALILASSGTTGLPKGVCKTHSQIIHHWYPMWDLVTEKQEVYFHFSTIDWITSTIFLVSAALYGGKRVITTKAFEPAVMVDICNRYEVTTFLISPAGISKIVQLPDLKPLESLKVFFGAGMTLSENLSKQLERFVPNGKVMALYGTTEGDYFAGAFKRQRFGSCGFPAENVQMKIIDDEGKHLGPNQIGEIHVKTKVLFSGYFNEPEKTKQTLLNGWIKTDDMGYFDDDGFLFIVDRKKAILKYDNMIYVFPSKIEEIIDAVEGVRYSCVVGVPDESGNDIISAFVEKVPNVEGLSAAELETFVNAKVSDAEKLRGGVHLVDRIPLTPRGKINRQEVKKLAEKIYRSKAPVFDIRNEFREST